MERVLVVNLDAHQGNGTAATIYRWPWASILDVYEDRPLPGVQAARGLPDPDPGRG